MSVIQTRCPACATAMLLEPNALLITVLPSHDRAGKVEFTCRSCDCRVARPIDGFVAARLRDEGVAFAPEAMAHHPSARGGLAGRPPTSEARGQAQPPPLTYDDLLDLHLLLQRDDWFDQFQAVVS